MKTTLGIVPSLVAMAFVTACSGRIPPPAPPRHTGLDVTFSHLELSNGLRVVLVHDPRAPQVDVTMRYRVGFVDDPSDQAGIAHYVEHLMFQQVLGTQSLFARLEDTTSNFNGVTTLDATTYTSRAPIDQLESLLSIEAVRLGFRCTGVADSTFDREREVVRNELRENGEVFAFFEAVTAGVYPDGHPYRKTSGNDASVASWTKERACAFADAHYTPNNAVLVIAGNLDAKRVEAALGKFLAKLKKREPIPPVAVPVSTTAGHRVSATAPADQELVIVGWPLTTDPLERIRLRAIAADVTGQVDATIKGRAIYLELGDGRAPTIGFALIPGKGETIDDAIKSAHKAIDDAPALLRMRGGLGELLHDRLQQTAIYQHFATLEGGGDRDTRIAAYVLEGRDPEQSLTAEVEGLRTMDRDTAAQIASTHLAFDKATVVTISPSGARTGHDVALVHPPHDLGQVRDQPPVDVARKPLDAPPPKAIGGIVQRTLGNGMHVVLLPITSVPTLDIRLVFGAGAADDPADKRGVALLAGYGLEWDLRFLNDKILFFASGGSDQVVVGIDSTAFIARGLDMHLDLLLAGIRRWTREGKYGKTARFAIDALRKSAKITDDDGAITDAVSTALYGADHPYAKAGIARHASESLTVADAAAFRARHFTPDNATLVISGRFDAALADKWIDFLFADWAGGHAVPRTSSAPTPHPLSIAIEDDLAQIDLRIAFPATETSHAKRLVVAAMVDDIANDIRHQLAASYGVRTNVVEQRLASEYLVSGAIDTSRAKEALELIKARIEALRANPDVAARSFALARKRVYAQLALSDDGAAVLGSRVQHDLELGRAPLAERDDAATVRALTIDAMAGAIADFDLSRAIVVMRGRKADVDPAFAVLGRTPARIATPDVDDPLAAAPAPPPQSLDDEPLYESDLEEAITTQNKPKSLALAANAGYTLGSITQTSVTGYTLAAEVGYHFGETTTLGLHASFARVSGSYTTTSGFVDMSHPLDATPLALGAFVQGEYGSLWMSVFAAFHYDHVIDVDSADTPDRWIAGFGIGLHVGYDILTFGHDHIGAFARAQGELGSTATYAAATFGLTYRR